MREQYTFERAYFVDLAERYAIDGSLLGKRLVIRHQGVCITIRIPAVLKRDVYPVLGIPGLFDKYGTDVEDWGKIRGYDSLDHPETIDAWISCILVVCQTNNPVLLFGSHVIQDMARKVIHALQIINPDAIRIPSDDAPNILCQVNHSVSFKEDGSPLIELGISSVIDGGTGRVSLNDIKNSLNNSGKTVSASFELLDNARVNLVRKDTRAAVLNSATAIEIILKQKVSTYCSSNHTTLELQNYLLKQADGYSKLVGLCKSIGISLGGIPNIEETVIKIRNRVIHGGYTPSYGEADIAYKDTRTCLSALGVQMFE